MEHEANTPTTEDDPLHVWFATAMLITAMDRAISEFELERTGSGLVVRLPDGTSAGLGSFVAGMDSSENEKEAAPVELVWNRIRQMAGMQGEDAMAGNIRLCDRRQPQHENVSIDVRQEEPGRFAFKIVQEEATWTINST